MIGGENMKKKQDGFATIDAYIQSFPPEVQKLLKELREFIHTLIPEAEEKISYQMPTFFLNGNLIHFAAFKNHIGLYPTPHGIEAFEHELAIYKRGKGSVQFPLTQALPLELIKKIVIYRLEENKNKSR
jgi:uncharacterized protein YdhG (YjbR/CyaY superfamily)